MDTNKPTDTKIAEGTAPVASAPVAQVAAKPAGAFRSGDRRGPRSDSRGGAGGKDRSKNPRRGGGRPERAKPEFDQKIMNIRRVTRVASGGRRFSFSVAVVIGNRNGAVGVGLGKAGDTSLAIDKAVRDAKKNMLNLTFTKTGSIPHELHAKYGSSVVNLMPAKGRGVGAGSAARTVIELAGMKDVSAKIISGSKNQLNIARATMKALEVIGKRRFMVAK
ncbi:MAG: 30S ribosomal protein S5 [Candidatus Paceibacterota bacterium]|jgi:small subunit ribosomal protein S5